jgi:glycosyltransferase involved in cell wall biosynthesis
MSLTKSAVSVVSTTYNEAGSILSLLESLASQTVHPGEVVFCDASNDQTADIIAEFAKTTPFPIRVIRRPGANISQGRNVAIDAAAGEIIAVTDAGVRLEPDWLERITAPFDDPDIGAVAGWFVANSHTVFETAMGATVLPLLDEIDPARYLPSSRSVAFRKAVWKRVGGYPEWLDHCEDVLLDQAVVEFLRTAGGHPGFFFEPRAVVRFQPRSNWGSYVRQYRNYASGDGRAFPLFLKRHLARYFTFLVAVPAIALLSVLSSPLWALAYLLAIPAMFLTGWRRLVRMWSHLDLLEKVQAFLLSPVIRVVGDVSKMIGYPTGLIWRVRHRGDAVARAAALAQGASRASAGASKFIL